MSARKTPMVVLSSGFAACIEGHAEGFERTATLVRMLRAAGIMARMTQMGAYCPNWHHVEVPERSQKRALQLVAAFTIGTFQENARKDPDLYGQSVEWAIESFPK